MKISTASYEEAKEDIISILNRNRFPALDEAYFSWRYTEVFGTPINCLAEINGKKVGLLTFFPRPLKIKGDAVVLGDTGHISVDKEHRRKGIALRLLKTAADKARESNIDFCFCMPNDLAKSVLIKAGWKEIGNIKYYRKLINIKPKLARIFKNSLLSECLGTICNSIFKFTSIEYLVKSEDYEFTEIDKIDETFDLLWQRTSNFSQIARVRDRTFLQWRFFNKPMKKAKYRIFGLTKDKKLQGYIVLLITPPVASIVDLFCVKKRELQLINGTIQYLRRSICIDSISIALSNKNPYSTALKYLGFIPIRKRLSICCYISSDNDSLDFLMNIRNWFITLADKDTV